jgi:GT2 family glycosyltransferase
MARRFTDFSNSRSPAPVKESNPWSAACFPTRVGTSKVSIIVVNWNGGEMLAECIESLCGQSYRHSEIILVDNGSTDSSAELARHNFPTVKLVELATNRGFTGGNVEGLKKADGEFIALVNNDAKAQETWLENLVRPMLEDRNVGICTSKLIFKDGGRINSAGDGLTTGGVGFNRGLGQDSTQFRNADYVFGGCGAAVLYRRRMLDEIGFFDEDFFLYDEDTDLNFRAQLAGWKCAFVPDAVAYHRGNATPVRLSDVHVYYHSRNLEWVWLKNMPTGVMLRYAHHKIFQEIGSLCYLCLRHGKWLPFIRAKKDALKMVPIMWRKRRTIQARRRVSNRYLRAQFSSMFTLSFFRQKLKQVIEG